MILSKLIGYEKLLGVMVENYCQGPIIRSECTPNLPPGLRRQDSVCFTVEGREGMPLLHCIFVRKEKLERKKSRRQDVQEKGRKGQDVFLSHNIFKGQFKIMVLNHL